MSATLPTGEHHSLRSTASGASTRRAWLVAALWSLLVAALLATPVRMRAVDGAWADKLVHALLFAVHFLLLARCLLSGRPALLAAAAAATLSALYAALLEVVQIAVPGRGFEWLDLAAGVVGIALAAVASAWRRATLEDRL